jgi:N6-L-threonylcarbamoyladenine synthase
MKILAVDTSCDETSVAVCENDWVLANKISSQIEMHKKWGGVVPGLARTLHNERIDIVIAEAMKKAKVDFEDIDVFAVTQGPGLAIALEVGITKIKDLARKYNKPIVAVNHMEGHIYSALAKNSKGKGVGEKIKDEREKKKENAVDSDQLTVRAPRDEREKSYAFPLLCLLISGGHTELVLMKNHGEYEILGKTLDDAIGEAFDKVARMLEFGYPGGPIVEQMAKLGDPKHFELPIPMIKIAGLDFSYSGLKTAALHLVRRELGEKKEILSSEQYKQATCDIAATFQEAAISSLIIKAKRALTQLKLEYEIKDIVIAGGVAINQRLRDRFRVQFSKEYNLHFPQDKKMYGDNAGMIGVAAYFNTLRNNFTNVDEFERDPILSL